jgi:hypothetical protein
MRACLLLASAALISVFAAGCNRSDLLDEIQCADDGHYVVVENNAFCVYPEQGVFPCPDELPFPVNYARSGFCAIEPSPPEALLAAALLDALESDAGMTDGSPIDGGATDMALPDAGSPDQGAE